MKAAALTAAALYSGSALAATSYSLVKDYAGQNFFDGWVFYDYYDNTTSGAYPVPSAPEFPLLLVFPALCGIFDRFCRVCR